jgi:hypothetical protein
VRLLGIVRHDGKNGEKTASEENLDERVTHRLCRESWVRHKSTLLTEGGHGCA